MTPQTIATIVGYLANPARRATIELEIPQRRLAGYRSVYHAQTMGANLPGRSRHIFTTTNKWGREMRLYFQAGIPANVPQALQRLATRSNRPGYNYNRRVNNNELIDLLFQDGFVVGSRQNAANIRARIPAALLPNFNAGYAL